MHEVPHIPILRTLATNIVTLLLISTGVSSCTAASQQREAVKKSDGNSANTGSSTATSTGASGAVEQGDEPAEVAGAFLTCDYSGAEASTPDDADIGCTVKNSDGTRMDVPSSAMSATLDKGDGAAAESMPMTASGDWHMTFEVAVEAMPKAVVTVRLGTGLLTAVDLTFALKDLAGNLLTSLAVAGYFDFKSVELTKPLTAASFCSNSGRRPAVVKETPNPVGNPVVVTIGTFTEIPANLTFTDATTCFEPLATYVGTEAGKLLAPSDPSGRLISSVPSTAGGTACFLAIAKLGTDDGPASALVVFDGDALEQGDLKRTAAMHACQD